MLAVLVAHGAQRETGTGEDATKDDETCKHRKTVSVACMWGRRVSPRKVNGGGVHNAGNEPAIFFEKWFSVAPARWSQVPWGCKIGKQ